MGLFDALITEQKKGRVIDVTFAEKVFIESELSESSPDKSSIYVIGAGVFNKESKKYESLRLLYIGETKSAEDRLTPEHEKIAVCKRRLQQGETLVFTWALVSHSANRELAEKALIYYVVKKLSKSLENINIPAQMPRAENTIIKTICRFTELPRSLPLPEPTK